MVLNDLPGVGLAHRLVEWVDGRPPITGVKSVDWLGVGQVSAALGLLCKEVDHTDPEPGLHDITAIARILGLIRL